MSNLDSRQVQINISLIVTDSDLPSGATNETLCEMTPAHVLLSDETVQPDSAGAVMLEERLPENWLPTYSGRFVHFKTKLRLEVMAKDGKMKIVWLSIRVYPPVVQFDSGKDGDSSVVLRRTNPFLPSTEDYQPVLYTPSLSSGLDSLGGCSSTAFFARISDANGEIAKLSLLRRHIQPGDSVVGLVDFRDTPAAARTCCQLSVSLVAVETFPPATVIVDPGKQNTMPSSSRSIYATTCETCFGTDAISFNVCAPETATPTFTTGFFTLSWVLRFEFVLSPSLRVQSPDQEYWRAPSKLQVKTRKWETPIFLYKL